MKKLLVLLLSLFIAGCAAESTTEKSVEPAKKIVVGGSTSVQPLMEKFAEAFKDNAEVEVQGGGSTVGYTQTVSEVFDLGMLSRDLKDSEKGKVSETVIAHDGIAVITNKENPVKSLTLAQVKDIFTGKVTNWNQLGGEDKEIVIISRESGSGTRAAFEEIVGYKSDELVKTSDIQSSTGAIIENVKSNKYTIGYISFGSLKDDINVLQIDNVTISDKAIKDKSYKIARKFIVVSKNDNAKKFVEFILSDAGQKIVTDNKYISVK